MKLSIKPASSCTYDQVSLGEVMLRLDPGEYRVRTARSFRASEGGGEYNVARGLAKCFGLRTSVVTSLSRNDIGYLIEELICAGRVDTRNIVWEEFDGIGLKSRNGLNFTERGFGVRGALGVSDRANTASSHLRPGDVDWGHLFGKLGVRWFHTGGIFAALSDTTAQVVLEALKSAKENGTITSYDLNYRPSLWKPVGGSTKAREVNQEIAKYIDVMLGNEEDFTACLGFSVGDIKSESLNIDAYIQMVNEVSKEYPNLQLIATTLREVKSASRNNWSAMAWCDGKVYKAKKYNDLEILDRVGGGDSFASGLIFGLIETGDPRQAVEYGAAHGALAMTTPGDTSMVSKNEVERLMKGFSARVQR